MSPNTGHIDQLDARLIEALRADPRVGLLEIARRVGVARGTVQARMAKLEARGVITGYGPEIEPHAMGYPISAFVFVELNQGRLEDAAEAARAVPDVLEGDASAGRGPVGERNREGALQLDHGRGVNAGEPLVYLRDQRPVDPVAFVRGGDRGLQLVGAGSSQRRCASQRLRARRDPGTVPERAV